MAAPRKYPHELRERAIRLAVDARKDPASRVGALSRIGGQLGINPETLRNWVTQAEIDARGRPGTTTTEPPFGSGGTGGANGHDALARPLQPVPVVCQYCRPLHSGGSAKGVENRAGVAGRARADRRRRHG